MLRRTLLRLPARRALHASLPRLQQTFDCAAAAAALDTAQAKQAAEVARSFDAAPVAGKPTARVVAPKASSMASSARRVA